MPLHPSTRAKLARLAEADREARAASEKARDEFYDCLVAARENATIRELAEIVGLSPGRVHELVTVRNRATAEKQAIRSGDR